MRMINFNIHTKNTMLNYIYRILSMLITYMMIPLTLKYLDAERYGIWQTMLTIISWASLTNFGIGNGLRNKVTEALTEKKYNKLKSYITSAYVYLTTISIIILIVSVILILNININTLFKNNTVCEKEIIISFIIIIFSFCFNFILGISSSIAFGIHKSSLVNLFMLITNIITLLGLIFLNIYTQKSIINIALLYLISNTISNLIFTSYLFIDKRLRPSLKLKNKKYGYELTSLGMEFFILQVASIVLFSTDNFIISKFIGAGEVTGYSIISKLFQLVSTFFSILLIQLWSVVAEATFKKNFKIIKNQIKKLIILLIPVSIVLIVIILNFDLILRQWLGKSVEYNNSLVYLSAFYAWLICFNGIFVNIQNGMSKIRIQTISSIIACIINIPMAIFFINVLNLGVVGVMMSNIICLMIASVLCSVDVILRLAKYTKEK